MTQLNDNNMDTAQTPRYETPTFDPRGAFARTLRSGELARLGRVPRQKPLPDPRKLASIEPVTARRVNGPRRYETPTFDARGAFARTLRSGEIARFERESRLRRLPDSTQLDAAAA